MITKTLILVTVAAELLFSQDKVLPLDAGSAGSIQVRPMTFTRTSIAPGNGAMLLLNSPYRVDVAVLTPSDQRVTEQNASAS